MEYQILGGVVQIDEADIGLISPFKWRIQKTVSDLRYARASVYYGMKDGVRVTKVVYMHRLILGLEIGDKRVGDHRNRDGLDNRRQNLRIATHAKNMANRKMKHMGAYRRSIGSWTASIRVGGRSIYLGSFPTEAQAQEAYRVAAHKHHGEFTQV